MSVTLRSCRQWSIVFWLVGATPFAVYGQQVESPAEVKKEQEFFELKVRPLLARHCFACHTNAKMGGLQLDTRENVLKGGKSGPAVIPGDPDRSLLIRAVNHTDPRLEMPPPGKLTSDEISVLQSWVKNGAVWGDPLSVSAATSSDEYVITPEQRAFWSFQPVREPPLPKVNGRSWVKSPIDAFILAKIEAQGLKPVEPASKIALISQFGFDRAASDSNRGRRLCSGQVTQVVREGSGSSPGFPTLRRALGSLLARCGAILGRAIDRRGRPPHAQCIPVSRLGCRSL